MTPDRFRECLTLLRWTQRGLAEALTCDDRLVRRWAAGGADIPASVAAWLETLGQCHEAAPPPQGWKRRVARSDEAEIDPVGVDLPGYGKIVDGR